MTNIKIQINTPKPIAFFQFIVFSFNNCPPTFTELITLFYQIPRFTSKMNLFDKVLFVLYHKIKAGGITYLYFLIFREEAKRTMGPWLPIRRCYSCRGKTHRMHWEDRHCPLCYSAEGYSSSDHGGLKEGQIKQVRRIAKQRKQKGKPVSSETIRKIIRTLRKPARSKPRISVEKEWSVLSRR